MKVVDNLPRFRNSVVNVLDDAISEAARDTLITSRRRAPFSKGPLRSSSETHRVKLLHHRVSYWLEYARYQELGGTATRRIRHYTTAGTGKGFLKKSGDEQVRKLNMTLRKHAMRARV